MDKPTTRIFISSPADVRPERLLAERIVARLDREFSYHFHVEAVLWEREPLVATHHFQDPRNIPRPSSTDIVVVILWSRLGVPLPEANFRGAISGRPVTGTEWEFEDALAAARQHDGVPDLLVYRKAADVVASLSDVDALRLRLEQKALLEDFVGRWFGTVENKDISAASHAFSTTQDFEEALYEHLAALLERKAGSLSEHAAIRWHGPPFRGLESFDLEHAQIFFGRTRARNELRETLARQVAANARTLLIVSGASGSGKSSLVKAGLLPDLRLPGMLARVALCRYAVLRPTGAENNPLRAVATAILSDSALPELRDLQYDVVQLEALLRAAPRQASLPINQGLSAVAKAGELVDTAQARLVLIVDQFEELFTDAKIGEEKRREFVAALDALAQTGLVWIVATLRSDFIDQLGELPELADAVNTNAHYFLSPPTDAEFGQMIRQPAREAGLRFEIRSTDGASLDETIRQAASSDPNVLPLLSFLLDELWRNRTSGGELTFEAYDRLGGLEGALAKRAEEIFKRQPGDVQSALPRILRALATIETDLRVTARTARLNQFQEGSAARTLIDSFAEARLFVKGEENGEGTVRVTHEALLTHWDVAAAQIGQDKSDLKLRSRLEADAMRWQSARPDDRDSLLLRPGAPLAEARDLFARQDDELDEHVRLYYKESESAARRTAISSALYRGTIAALALIVIVAGTWGLTIAARQYMQVHITGVWQPGSGAVGIASDWDGALWIADETSDDLVRMAIDGSLTDDSADGGPMGVVVGPDGAIWYTEYKGDKIGRIATKKRLGHNRNLSPVDRSEFPLSHGSNPNGITNGPDGALWFTETGLGRIGRITSVGSVKEFPLKRGAGPSGIVLGPDGALWFAEYGRAKIGRITTNGTVREFALEPRSQPGFITVGSDNALWFTEDAGNKIGRITLAGDIREFPVSGYLFGGSGARGIVSGPDGALWFTEYYANRIGRITTNGDLREFDVGFGSKPAGITLGSDDTLWFTDDNWIGKITPGHPIGNWYP